MIKTSFTVDFKPLRSYPNGLIEGEAFFPGSKLVIVRYREDLIEDHKGELDEVLRGLPKDKAPQETEAPYKC